MLEWKSLTKGRVYFIAPHIPPGRDKGNMKWEAGEGRWEMPIGKWKWEMG